MTSMQCCVIVTLVAWITYQNLPKSSRLPPSLVSTVLCKCIYIQRSLCEGGRRHSLRPLHTMPLCVGLIASLPHVCTISYTVFCYPVIWDTVLLLYVMYSQVSWFQTLCMFQPDVFLELTRFLEVGVYIFLCSPVVGGAE